MRLQCINVGLIAFIILGLTSSCTLAARMLSGTNLQIRIQQCREGCLEKFAIKEDLCQQRPECSTNGFPPYNYNSLPDALHLLCWDECAKPPPPKINKSIRETWALRTVSMLQQDSLVLVDVAWAPLNTPNQCLVTWEVSGGGLMGNLLTESFNVQLSLWPDTKYRVQVTCKNNNTSAMSRSLPLTIDTAEAITPQEKNEQQQQKHSSTTLLPVSGFVLKPAINSDIIDQNIDSSSEEQSNELINQHTNFIFNWHQRNSDISRIEPIKKPNFNMLTIAALSDIQKSLLFGVITGAILLAIILSLFVCMLRNQRVPSDKAALIEEDANAVGITVPVSVPNSTNSVGSSCYDSDPNLYSRTLHHVLKV